MRVNKEYINIKLLERYKQNSLAKCRNCLAKELNIKTRSIANLLNSKNINFKLLTKIIIMLDLDISKIFIRKEILNEK